MFNYDKWSEWNVAFPGMYNSEIRSFNTLHYTWGDYLAPLHID